MTSSVVYSVCEFDYYYNTSVTPSVLDGGSHILLANMFSPKRPVFSHDFHMTHPVPGFLMYSSTDLYYVTVTYNQA